MYNINKYVTIRRESNLNTNLFWCIIGIVGGAIFSLFISLFFYFKGLNKRRLGYYIKTFCIVSKKINQIIGLEVKYNSTEINNLFSSTITIKNIGNSIIEKQDFAPSFPISISTDDIFLANNITNFRSSNKVTNVKPLFEIDSNGTCNKITIDFDYIPKKEEIIFSVYHTGNIELNGLLKDGEIINYQNLNQKRQPLMHILESIIPTIISMESLNLSISLKKEHHK